MLLRRAAFLPLKKLEHYAIGKQNLSALSKSRERISKENPRFLFTRRRKEKKNRQVNDEIDLISRLAHFDGTKQ